MGMLSYIKHKMTPNFRKQKADVSMFYVDRPCCAHCSHGANLRRKVYCNLVSYEGYKFGIPRSKCSVHWYGICDSYEPKAKGQKT